jgi:hypothetical protein
MQCVTCNKSSLFASKLKILKKNKETTNILVNQKTSRKFVHKDLLMNMVLNFYFVRKHKSEMTPFHASSLEIKLNKS